MNKKEIKKYLKYLKFKKFYIVKYKKCEICNSKKTKLIQKNISCGNNKLGDISQWRKPDIIADAILEIINEDPKIFTGNQLIDEEYLKTKGVTDFSKYRCLSNHEPPDLDESFENYLLR